MFSFFLMFVFIVQKDKLSCNCTWTREYCTWTRETVIITASGFIESVFAYLLLMENVLGHTHKAWCSSCTETLSHEHTRWFGGVRLHRPFSEA